MELPQAIIDTFGGSVVYIPQKPTQELQDLLGDKAQAFCNHYKGDAVYIPNQYQYKAHQKHLAIVSRYHETSQHLSPTKAKKIVAREFGVSVRWVEMLLKRHLKTGV